MGSNVVIDQTVIAGLQSAVATINQFLTKGQYYYQGNANASASVYPYLQSGTTNTMSVYQTSVTLTVNAAKQGVQLIVPPNSFKDRPIVNATIECATAPGMMSAVITDIATTSWGISFDIYTQGSIPPNGVPATIHVTAISYE